MTQAMLYDPPSGWKYGFPKPYAPLDGEAIADTLRRDGYPEREIERGSGKHVRFWADKGEGPSPVAAHGAVTTDEQTGEVLEVMPDFLPYPRITRYPAPARADLVTLWKRGSESVLSIAADGKVQDFHLPPARLVVLLRELADLLAESTILK